MDFRILGPLEVVADGRTLPVSGQKRRAVLALLLLRPNRAVPADFLIEELWGEQPPQTARNTLQVYVGQLRKLLGKNRLVTDAAGYRLDVEPREVDLERFEQLLAEGRQLLASGRPERAALQLREALALWRGRPFADLRYVGFAEREAERLEELRLQALEERIEAELALGRYAEIVQELRSLLQEHPLRERLRAQLMLALYRSGRQVEALEVYTDGRRTLDELGLEPATELRALERAILNQDPALAPPAAARAHLPIGHGTFVDRERERAELGDLLQRQARLVTITGPPGVGKTRLAIELARELAAEYSDGVYFVDLAPLRHPAALAGALESALAVDSSAAGDGHEEVLAYVRDRELLIVVDNCEHLPDTGPVVQELLRAAPALRFLLTSREPTRITEELVYRLSPLGDADAVILFAERAQSVSPGFLLTPENDPIVSEICDRLEGLPLALELAAARMRLFDPQALRDRLAERLQLLSGGDCGLPPRQRTLRATIGWSYDLLDEPERRLLRQLSVFVGGFDAAAAAAVGGAGERALQALVEKSLVSIDEVEANQRYRLLETVREVAAELLARSGEDEEVWRRYSEFFRELAVQRELDSAYDHVWYQRLRADHPNLRAVLRGCLSRGDLDQAAELAASLTRFWTLQRHVGEATAWLEEVLLHRDGLSTPVLARVLVSAGQLDLRKGDIAKARPLLHEALELARQACDLRTMSLATLGLGTAAGMSGELAESAAFTEEGLAIARLLGDPMRVAETLNNLGVVQLLQGRYDEARAVLLESREIYEELQDRLGVTFALVNLGHVAIEQGDFEEAGEFCRDALRSALETEYQEGVAESCEGLAALAAESGKAEVAARLAGAAAALRDELGVPLPDSQRPPYERRLAAAQQELGAVAFGLAFESGRKLTREELTAVALGPAAQVP